MCNEILESFVQSQHGFSIPLQYSVSSLFLYSLFSVPSSFSSCITSSPGSLTAFQDLTEGRWCWGLVHVIAEYSFIRIYLSFLTQSSANYSSFSLGNSPSSKTCSVDLRSGASVTYFTQNDTIRIHMKSTIASIRHCPQYGYL